MVIQRKVKVIKASDILNEKIRQLITLAKQQGFLTVRDINSHLPDSVKKADEIENVINILDSMSSFLSKKRGILYLQKQVSMIPS